MSAPKWPQALDKALAAAICEAYARGYVPRYAHLAEESREITLVDSLEGLRGPALAYPITPGDVVVALGMRR